VPQQLVESPESLLTDISSSLSERTSTPLSRSHAPKPNGLQDVQTLEEALDVAAEDAASEDYCENVLYDPRAAAPMSTLADTMQRARAVSDRVHKSFARSDAEAQADVYGRDGSGHTRHEHLQDEADRGTLALSALHLVRQECARSKYPATSALDVVLKRHQRPNGFFGEDAMYDDMSDGSVSSDGVLDSPPPSALHEVAPTILGDRVARCKPNLRIDTGQDPAGSSPTLSAASVHSRATQNASAARSSTLSPNASSPGSIVSSSQMSVGGSSSVSESPSLVAWSPMNSAAALSLQTDRITTDAVAIVKSSMAKEEGRCKQQFTLLRLREDTIEEHAQVELQAIEHAIARARRPAREQGHAVVDTLAELEDKHRHVRERLATEKTEISRQRASVRSERKHNRKQLKAQSDALLNMRQQTIALQSEDAADSAASAQEFGHDDSVGSEEEDRGAHEQYDNVNDDVSGIFQDLYYSVRDQDAAPGTPSSMVASEQGSAQSREGRRERGGARREAGSVSSSPSMSTTPSPVPFASRSRVIPHVASPSSKARSDRVRDQSIRPPQHSCTADSEKHDVNDEVISAGDDAGGTRDTNLSSSSSPLPVLSASPPTSALGERVRHLPSSPSPSPSPSPSSSAPMSQVAQQAFSAFAPSPSSSPADSYRSNTSPLQVSQAGSKTLLTASPPAFSSAPAPSVALLHVPFSATSTSPACSPSRLKIDTMNPHLLTQSTMVSSSLSPAHSPSLSPAHSHTSTPMEDTGEVTRETCESTSHTAQTSQTALETSSQHLVSPDTSQPMGLLTSPSGSARVSGGSAAGTSSCGASPGKSPCKSPKGFAGSNGGFILNLGAPGAGSKGSSPASSLAVSPAGFSSELLKSPAFPSLSPTDKAEELEYDQVVHEVEEPEDCKDSLELNVLGSAITADFEKVEVAEYAESASGAGRTGSVSILEILSSRDAAPSALAVVLRDALGEQAVPQERSALAHIAEQDGAVSALAVLNRTMGVRQPASRACSTLTCITAFTNANHAPSHSARLVVRAELTGDTPQPPRSPHIHTVDSLRSPIRTPIKSPRPSPANSPVTRSQRSPANSPATSSSKASPSSDNASPARSALLTSSAPLISSDQYDAVSYSPSPSPKSWSRHFGEEEDEEGPAEAERYILEDDSDSEQQDEAVEEGFIGQNRSVDESRALFALPSAPSCRLQSPTHSLSQSLATPPFESPPKAAAPAKSSPAALSTASQSPSEASAASPSPPPSPKAPSKRSDTRSPSANSPAQSPSLSCPGTSLQKSPAKLPSKLSAESDVPSNVPSLKSPHTHFGQEKEETEEVEVAAIENTNEDYASENSRDGSGGDEQEEGNVGAAGVGAGADDAGLMDHPQYLPTDEGRVESEEEEEEEEEEEGVADANAYWGLEEEEVVGDVDEKEEMDDQERNNYWGSEDEDEQQGWDDEGVGVDEEDDHQEAAVGPATHNGGGGGSQEEGARSCQVCVKEEAQEVADEIKVCVAFGCSYF